MTIPRREQPLSASEAKDPLFLPDDVPAMPDDFLKKFPEFLEWQKKLNDWWVDIKDILIRRQRDTELIEATEQLATAISELVTKTDELNTKIGEAQDCCDGNTDEIKDIKEDIVEIQQSIIALSDSIGDLIAGVSDGLGEHIAETETHGANGDIVGRNTLNDEVESLTNKINDLAGDTGEIISNLHQFQDLGSVDDTTPSPLSEDYDPARGIIYKFIEISPQAGAAPYVLDVDLNDDNNEDIIVEFFINGLASANPTIRLVTPFPVILNAGDAVFSGVNYEVTDDGANSGNPDYSAFGGPNPAQPFDDFLSTAGGVLGVDQQLKDLDSPTVNTVWHTESLDGSGDNILIRMARVDDTFKVISVVKT
jgi:predicted  nucleic acid-binding Zn-ribbon protein